MKLRYHSNPKLWEGGDASGAATYGNLTVVKGELFVDDVPLLALLKNFIGRKGMMEFVFPESVEHEIDEKILPLVQVLQARGLHTLGSCQGHLEMTQDGSGAYRRTPYVTFYAETLPDIPEGWRIENSGNHEKVWKLRAIEEVVDEASQARIAILIKKAVEFYQ